MNIGCVDLVERFGTQYRITWDPAYDPGHVARDKRDPWHAQIPCRYGVIYPQGGDFLAAEVDNHRMLTKPLLAIKGVRLSQDGDHEKTFLFPVELFDQVAAILQPRRKRLVSEEVRRLLADMSALHGFKAAPTHQPDEALAPQIDPDYKSDPGDA
ncbi:MAG: hypothetical protein ACREJC_13835 [Tepidisphaeraceae bacterium]